MSQENVEAVRLAYEVAYVERSIENVRERFDENFVWHSRPDFPGRAEYRADEMSRLWAELDETYTEFSLVTEDFMPVGAYVVATIRTGTRMRGSDARIDTTSYHVWHVPDGKPREAWSYGTREEALEAVGLSE